MRIFLLRLLIGSWMIPFIWIMFFPILWLIAGVDYAIKDALEITKDLWFGIKDK